ncbi:MAG: hypothetical protein E7168_01450 [Firmicutes bacterium]|nr:hypothetical protein [Bacillota bacterium]
MTQLATAMFTAEQITSVQTAITTAAGNVISMFVDLLPVMAIICGVGFGISFVKGLFNKVKRGK